MQRHASDHDDARDIANHGLIVPYQILAAVTSGLIVLQAFLAGQWLFKGRTSSMDHHEIVGSLFLVLLIVQIAATVPLTKPGSYYRRHLLTQNGLILVLALVQMWLGYEAKDSSNAAVAHLPLGVFLCAYAGGVFSHAWGFKRHFGV
ncbi:MAG: hypothetical protein KF883_09450 [Thermomicrobiales bacterium]|nr:hypothetical protein [Thermomicrobiales bacterium]